MKNFWKAIWNFIRMCFGLTVPENWDNPDTVITPQPDVNPIEPPGPEPQPWPPEPSNGPVKRALLIGINDYPTSPLRGCVNDVLLMYKMLWEKFDFDPDNIRVLTDREATKDNIIDELEYIVEASKAGDTIYIHYSGHGSQVVVSDWTDSDEADGRDEILCPVDMDWDDPFRDHELGAILQDIVDGVDTVVCLDCCHSGTGLRNTWVTPTELKTPRDVVNRFIPPPVDNILSNPKIKIDENLNFELPTPDVADKQTLKNGFLIDTAKQKNIVLLAGCQENQTSADSWFGERYQGAMTYTLVKTLAEADYELSFAELISRVNSKLDKIGEWMTQNPQLECKKELFDDLFLR